jgi:hypothetical protein
VVDGYVLTPEFQNFLQEPATVWNGQGQEFTDTSLSEFNLIVYLVWGNIDKKCGNLKKYAFKLHLLVGV